MSGFGPSMTISLKASTPTGTVVPMSHTASNLPEFSADGTKITWMETAGQAWSIKVANADGSNKVTLVSGASSPNANNPTFSPNGNFIAFDYGNDIYVLSATATGKAIADASRLTTSSGMGNMATKPKYLTATKIVYAGMQSGNTCSNSLYNGLYVKDTMAAGNGTLLTNSCDSGMNRTYPIDFDVSPDGNWIAYRGVATNNFIALIKSDNTGSRISVYSASSGSNNPQGRPVFSPDGTKIVYNDMTSNKIVSWDGTTVGSATNVVFPSGVNSPSEVAWAPASAVLSATTTVAPTTTIAATTTVPKTATAVASYANAIPGVTITDAKVYTAAPVKVSADSAINAMTPAEAKTYDIVSKTPSVCLPNDDDLVFLDDGKCIATIVNEKTRAVLRTLKTTVVSTDISTLKVGNEIAVLSPLYFDAGSADMKAASSKRLTSLLPTIKKAGSILIAGHSGSLMGNTLENQALSKSRATSVVTALKKLGATAPIAIAAVGALDPVSTGTSKAAQDKNRRAVVVLIP
jgi:outer membrane protein OmpA-like peptidoglycan-associated protein/Tol biopolymer transport system component